MQGEGNDHDNDDDGIDDHVEGSKKQETTSESSVSFDNHTRPHPAKVLQRYPTKQHHVIEVCTGVESFIFMVCINCGENTYENTD